MQTTEEAVDIALMESVDKVEILMEESTLPEPEETEKSSEEIGGNGRNANYFSNGGNGGNGYYPGRGGSPYSSTSGVAGRDGIAITNNMIIGTAPLRGMTPETSIVIIEYGNSLEDF